MARRVPGSARRTRETTYADRAEACANFVLHELRDGDETGAMLSSPFSLIRAIAGWFRSR
jgi:hypothetical protein